MNAICRPIALATVPDLGSASLRVGGTDVLSATQHRPALSLDVTTWAAVKSVWAIGSKVGLFLIQYAVMKTTGVRRARAMMAAT